MNKAWWAAPGAAVVIAGGIVTASVMTANADDPAPTRTPQAVVQTSAPAVTPDQFTATETPAPAPTTVVTQAPAPAPAPVQAQEAPKVTQQSEPTSQPQDGMAPPLPGAPTPNIVPLTPDEQTTPGQPGAVG